MHPVSPARTSFKSCPLPFFLALARVYALFVVSNSPFGCLYNIIPLVPAFIQYIIRDLCTRCFSSRRTQFPSSHIVFGVLCIATCFDIVPVRHSFLPSQSVTKTSLASSLPFSGESNVSVSFLFSFGSYTFFSQPFSSPYWSDCDSSFTSPEQVFSFSIPSVTRLIVYYLVSPSYKL